MRIVVFPGDSRQRYLAKELEKKKYEVVLLPVNVKKQMPVQGKENIQYLGEIIRQAEMIILPTPSLCSDGRIRVAEGCDWKLSGEEFAEMVCPGQTVFGSALGKGWIQELQQRGVCVHDLMESDVVALRNAVATAEGAIAEAIGLGEGNLQDAKCLVIGFGRCGSILAHKLKGLCKSVCVMARRTEVLVEAEALGFQTMAFENAEIGEFEYVFNTVPAKVLNDKQLSDMESGVVIIDLASAPGGVDYDYCAKHNICAKLCSGLPGKYSPKTSGIILAEEIGRCVGWKD